MTKFLNTILILIILVTGAKLVMQGQEYRALSQERNQLLEKLDGFRVRDPGKYLVQAVDTDDPMLFMWRVHKPGGFETEYWAEFGRDFCDFGCGGSWKSELERVSARFEFVGDKLYVDIQTARGGHRARVGGAELVPIFQQHWDDLEIEILGQGGAVEIDVNQEVVFMHITVPNELLTKFGLTKFGTDMGRRFSREFICRFSLGQYGVMKRNREQWQGGSK